MEEEAAASSPTACGRRAGFPGIHSPVLIESSRCGRGLPACLILSTGSDALGHGAATDETGCHTACSERRARSGKLLRLPVCEHSVPVRCNDARTLLLQIVCGRSSPKEVG